MDPFDDFLGRWSAAHGGMDARSSPWVLGWLGLVHRGARPLARRRVHPSTLTGASVACAVVAALLAAVGGHWVLLGVVAVVATSYLDGLDGAVAVLTDTATAWGRVLDPLADRVGDVAFLVALTLLGAPGPLAVGVGVLTLLQESVRTAAGAAGMTGVGVVTVWERPARVIVTAFALAAAGALPARAPLLVTVAAVVAAALAVAGMVQLLVVVRRALRPA